MQPAESNVSIDRLRSGRACLGCRKRKNRCDGERPICAFCKKRSLICEYVVAGKKSGASQSYVDSLENKVQHLQQLLLVNSSDAQLPPSSTASADSAGDNVSKRPRLSGSVNSYNENLSSRPSSSCVNVTNAIERQASNNISPQRHRLDYNLTSVQSTMTDIGLMSASTPPDSSGVSDDTIVVGTSSDKINVIRASNELDPDNFTLPRKDIAKELVDHFFCHSYPLYPVVDERSFREQLNVVYSSDKERPSVAWLSIANLIFAFGADYLHASAQDAYDLAQRFHKRATELVLSVCFESSTVEIVQALFLLTAHLQSNLRLNKCWASVGCLIRTAHGLRLNVDPTDWNISPVDKEIRKRLWWAIYALDCFISLKQGQLPALTSDSLPAVSPPSTYYDICRLGTMLGTGSSLVKPEPTSIHFFNATVQLSHIAETMLVTAFREAPWMFSNNEDFFPRPAEIDNAHFNAQIAHINEQEAKLALWQRALPEHLKLNHATKQSPLTSMLELRYLYTRLLIHRQVLLMVVGHGNRNATLPDDSYLSLVIGASARQCAECAVKIIDIVVGSHAKKTLGPWWYNMQFIYAALGTMLALHASRTIFDSIDKSLPSASIVSACDYIHQLATVNPLLEKCSKYFDSLRLRMTKVATRPKHLHNPRETVDETTHAKEGSDIPQSQHSTGTLTDGNVGHTSMINDSPFSEYAGSLDDDWSRLLLEPLLPDFDSEIFNSM